MSLELLDVIHTRAQAFEALKRIAARHGRPLNPDALVRLTHRADKKRRERCIELCEALIDLLAASFGASGAEIRSPLRGRQEVSRIRQIGMYVAHTSLGMAMNEVALGFARDRTTVMHACHAVEDLRDDLEFDALVSLFEKIVNSAFTAWRMAA
ncbi:DNA replication initiation ATPase [Brucella sp. 191011898]|nr:DNA replication initiation ATPase [Brucella sp. 191011898]